MPVFHFNIHDGEILPDPTGHELPDIASAKRQAIGMSGQMIRELGEEFWKGEEWQLEVTDDRGLVLFTLAFFATIAPTLSHS